MSGEKYNWKKDRAGALSLIDKVVGIADEYYDMITDRILEKVTQGEENVERDKEVAKEIAEKLTEGADKYVDVVTSDIAEKISK